jgi:hypothetical protein
VGSKVEYGYITLSITTKGAFDPVRGLARIHIKGRVGSSINPLTSLPLQYLTQIVCGRHFDIEEWPTQGTAL